MVRRIWCRTVTLSLALGLALAGEHDRASAQPVVGLKAGLSVADVRGEVTGSNSPIENFTASFFVELGPPQGLSVQLEASFVQRGTFEENLDDGLGTTFEYGAWDYQYWDIAVVPKLTVGSGSLRGAVYAGPYVGTLFGATLTTDQEKSTSRGGTKPIDLGAIVGVSLETELGFLIDLRYVPGFKEFDGGLFEPLYQRKHSVLAAMIGMSWS